MKSVPHQVSSKNGGDRVLGSPLWKYGSRESCDMFGVVSRLPQHGFQCESRVWPSIHRFRLLEDLVAHGDLKIALARDSDRQSGARTIPRISERQRESKPGRLIFQAR